MTIKSLFIAICLTFIPALAHAQACGDTNPDCPEGQIFDDLTGSCEDFTIA